MANLKYFAFRGKYHALNIPAMFPGHGFTLLEVCLALVIHPFLIKLAVRSIATMLCEQRLMRSFENFDQFVQESKITTVREHGNYVMVSGAEGITLAAAFILIAGATLKINEADHTQMRDTSRAPAGSPCLS